MSDERLIGYCAGKLTGSDEEATKLFFEIRDGLEQFGIDLYLPTEHTGPGTGSTHPLNSTSEHVCTLDIYRVGFADFTIAAFNKPSLGTGMELIIAQDRMVSIFAYYQKELELEKDVSRMPVGLSGIARVGTAGSLSLLDARQKVILYQDVKDLIGKLAGQILHFKPMFLALRETKRSLDESWRELDLGTVIKKRMEEQGISLIEMSTTLGISPELVQYLTLTQVEFEDLFNQELRALEAKANEAKKERHDGHEEIRLKRIVIRPESLSAMRYVNPTATQLAILGRVLGMDLFRIIADATTPHDDIGEPLRIPADLMDSYGILQRVANGTSHSLVKFLINEEILDREKAALFRQRKDGTTPRTPPGEVEWRRRLEKLRKELADGNLFA